MISIVPAPLSAKGNTVKITIKGAGITTPLEITDPKIREFHVWAGPGAAETEGFIIEWSKGVVAQPPTGLQHCEVSFYSGCQSNESDCRAPEPHLVYVVSYAYNPSTEQGYIYLPGRSDELFKFNAATILHGHSFEGHWLRATSAWGTFARPLIAKARR
jgi:hypothetical protein